MKKRLEIGQAQKTKIGETPRLASQHTTRIPPPGLSFSNIFCRDLLFLVSSFRIARAADAKGSMDIALPLLALPSDAVTMARLDLLFLDFG